MCLKPFSDNQDRDSEHLEQEAAGLAQTLLAAVEVESMGTILSTLTMTLESQILFIHSWEKGGEKGGKGRGKKQCQGT